MGLFGWPSKAISCINDSDDRLPLVFQALLAPFFVFPTCFFGRWFTTVPRASNLAEKAFPFLLTGCIGVQVHVTDSEGPNAGIS